MRKNNTMLAGVDKDGAEDREEEGTDVVLEEEGTTSETLINTRIGAI